MRPLKLHAKTTLIVSSVVVVIFFVAAWVFTRQAIGLEQNQYKERALQLATYYADQVARIRVLQSINGAQRSSAPGFSQAELIQGYGFEVTLSQVYSFQVPEDGPPRAQTVYTDPRSTAPAVELPPETITKLLTRDFPDVEVHEHPDGRFSVWAVAPVIVTTRGAEQSVVGAVGVQVEVTDAKSLAAKMARQAFIALALMVFGIATVTYWIFKRLVYEPIDTLLGAMTRAESGDLSVKAPERAEDEVGLLTTRFNIMVDRLREYTEERAAHARQLEERVRDATGELEDRNEQLKQKNVELFGIQRQLGTLERLATAGQLAAQFAHEVGTPLNLISGHVQLLRARSTDEKTTKRLETIAAQIERIERIVRGMLDQTRRPAVRLEPVDLGALLARTFDTIDPTLAAKRVRLIAELQHDLPRVNADADQLQQIFINLVNNSLDAMPEGGELRVIAGRVGSDVQLRFADTGHGIAEADLPHLFEPLFTTKERGSGLGLAVSHQIIHELGGSIDVESTPDGGAAFTIRLPIPSNQSLDEPSDASDEIHETTEPSADVTV